MFRQFALSGLLALASLGAAAQTTLHYREGQRVEPQDVKRILENTDAAASRSRSIRVLGESPATSVAAAQSQPSALSLPVHFDFDSSNLSPAGREQLDALAQGIKLLPAERKVVIEGHTDARGPDDYNQQLSLRRAAAVKQYLVDEHGIDPARLHDTGFGKRQPITEADPFSAANRRVQFRGG
jgi:outer membrane protein OmpA-like peptidoglycan-associated protein